MPYIVTTKSGTGGQRSSFGALGVLSRRAVTTLDEARLAAFDVVADTYAGWPHNEGIRRARRAASDLPEQGGSVGPLPDGTVIEVSGVGWQKLAADAGEPFRSGAQRWPSRRAEIMAAYNAAQEATA